LNQGKCCKAKVGSYLIFAVLFRAAMFNMTASQSTWNQKIQHDDENSNMAGISINMTGIFSNMAAKSLT